MTDENTVFDAAFEYRMNGMSEESARVAASEDETKDARIAELETYFRLILTETQTGKSNPDRVCSICVFALQDNP
jgi:hypothetical protein